jgi:hypothetical protein
MPGPGIIQAQVSAHGGRFKGGSRKMQDSLRKHIYIVGPDALILELRKLGLAIDAGQRTTAHPWKPKYPVLPPASKEEKSIEDDPQQLLG